MSTSGPALDRDRLEADKSEAEEHLMNLLQFRATLDSQSHLNQSPSGSACSESVADDHIEHYLDLHRRLSRARSAASDLSRKKVDY